MPSISPEHLNLFQDKTFPSLTIKDFCAKQLAIMPEAVEDTLFAALPEEQQTEENKGYITTAMNHTVNASGSTIILANTNAGLHLVYGNSQRRKRVIAHNGTCEAGESMQDTALREFSEELGNPDVNGVLSKIVNNADHHQSLAISNNIGETAAQIASKIVYEKANKNALYFNMSLIICNQSPVKFSILCEEIRQTNERLKQAPSYYKRTTALRYGDRANNIPAADLDKDLAARSQAIELINDFKMNAQAIITVELKEIFNLDFTPEMSTDFINKALKAIIDLTETNAIGVIGKKEIIRLLESDVNKINEQGYFKPSFKNLVAHQGQLSASEFLGQFKTKMGGAISLFVDSRTSLQIQTWSKVNKPNMLTFSSYQFNDTPEPCVYDSGEFIPVSRTPYPGSPIIGELPVITSEQESPRNGL